MSELTVAALDRDRLDDFFAVHTEANGLAPCFCVAWEVPTWDEWRAGRPAAENEALRRRLFALGRYEGYILYEDGAPVGWCKVSPRDALPKLARQFDLAPDPEVMAIACFALAPSVRKRGYAHRLLAMVLDELRARGVNRVEAYPRAGTHDDDGAVWTGPLALFEKAGFTPVAPAETVAAARAEGRPTVMVLELA